MVQKRNYTAVKLQLGSNGQYRLTIPAYMVEQNLVAKKGDKIDLEVRGDSVILRKQK